MNKVAVSIFIIVLARSQLEAVCGVRSCSETLRTLEGVGGRGRT